jgi:hypothetical protein
VNQDTPLIRSLRAAVEASPEDVPLRLHLAELLLDAGRGDEAVTHIAAALQRVPNSVQARTMMARAVAGQRGTDSAPGRPRTNQPGSGFHAGTPAPGGQHRQDGTARFSRPVPAVPNRRAGDEPTERHNFNWLAAEGQFVGVPQPFVDSGTAPLGEPIRFDVEMAKLRLSDVIGMAEVKRRLDALFVAPRRSRGGTRPTVGGGVVLYGPPGVGKTFLARAAAGELGARFLAVNLADGPEIWTGSPERNLREVFTEARRAAPCLLFLDEVDSLGHKRKQGGNPSNPRGMVNTLLAELEGVGRDGDGLFVLAGSSNPWDMDPVLRRPGRLDRMLLVAPPDQPAREAILHHLLREHRLAGINLRELAKRTEEYSAADLAGVCEIAVERAGAGRPVGQRDFEAALAELRGSTAGWLSIARNATAFANADGSYDDLHLYLKRRRTG